MVLGTCPNISIKIKKFEIRKYTTILVCYCFVTFETSYRSLKKSIIWFIFGFILLLTHVNSNWFLVSCFKYWKKNQVGGIHVYHLVFVELISIFNSISSSTTVICCFGFYLNSVTYTCKSKVLYNVGIIYVISYDNTNEIW